MLLVHMIDSRISNPSACQPGSLAGALRTTGRPRSLWDPRTHTRILQETRTLTFLIKSWMHTLLNRLKEIHGYTSKHMNMQFKHINTHTHTVGRGNIAPQRWRVVTGGLSDAAAQRGPLGLSMQLCGGMDQRCLSKGFGQTPPVVSWMAAPSLRSPNVHRWLPWSCAM